MLDALVRRVDVVADRGADPAELAGRDRRADAGSADEDAAIGIAGEDRLAELARLVGIVDANGIGVGSEVDGRIPQGRERFEHDGPEMDATMVESDRNPHHPTLPLSRLVDSRHGRR